ncbi:hypothetical protein ID866_12152 [Astraeus odoratus]|nr:hypothetical protein ID866_12152 [Astraeus odoratus]
MATKWGEQWLIGRGGEKMPRMRSSAERALNTSYTQFSSILSGAHLRSQRALRQVQNVRRYKDRNPIPTGDSTHGMTLAFGDWGIRIKGMTAKEVIKRKIKVIKGVKVYLGVFPDIPVCIKCSDR